MKANALEIQTPEGVTFSLALAGPVSRCLAWMLDLCVVLMLGALLTVGLALVGWLSPDLARAVLVLGWFLVQVGYGAAFEWFWNGQTPGKRCLGLRVIDAEGFRLTFNQVLMRNLLRFPDDLVEGLSDEQLVRNVVEAVFRSAPREIPGEPRETSRATIFR